MIFILIKKKKLFSSTSAPSPGRRWYCRAAADRTQFENNSKFKENNFLTLGWNMHRCWTQDLNTVAESPSSQENKQHVPLGEMAQTGKKTFCFFLK